MAENACRVCGRPGDKHHIVHREEGGIDFPLNVIYLCREHHNGRHGPHRDPATDLQYKKEMHDNLARLFDRRYYTKQEIQDLSKVTNSTLLGLCKALRKHKEGYLNIDIIFYLMGGFVIKEEDYTED